MRSSRCAPLYIVPAYWDWRKLSWRNDPVPVLSGNQKYHSLYVRYDTKYYPNCSTYIKSKTCAPFSGTASCNRHAQVNEGNPQSRTSLWLEVLKLIVGKLSTQQSAKIQPAYEIQKCVFKPNICDTILLITSGWWQPSGPQVTWRGSTARCVCVATCKIHTWIFENLYGCWTWSDPQILLILIQMRQQSMQPQKWDSVVTYQEWC